MPSLADMLKPSMQTLKNIVLTIRVHAHYEDVDPLFGIPSEFEVMRSRNIIETVTIKINVDADAGYRRDEWGRLDKVLTTPGWFSLKRVSLTIEIVPYLGRSNEVEVSLRNLPETQFRRLSSSNSVSFDFKINGYQTL